MTDNLFIYSSFEGNL